jgi:hypothetical protein
MAKPEAPLIVSVPATVLADGDFVLSVEGEAVRDRSSSLPFHLTVVRQRGGDTLRPFEQ